MTAAPLKHAGAMNFDAAFGDFPRSHDRGPIEAMFGKDFPCSDPTAFRGHMTAAPLKRGRGRRGRSGGLGRFPRSHDRGPIEARRWGLWELEQTWNAFRGHMTAAPLKQCHRI